ncbi:VOC family protein [Heyndrickxia camelliae]|uniref:Ring-cleaving dioxygenase n=1 Tax=Heyndrickxia camelliae TaxID=1707093 RepID=A0A2N3LIY9_9BACI|nr:VOC family protein [Heyndrickxia camelliae]PKR84547.1 ring-cleaving dioxygenase [Heyndrickxia camelliae]
MIIEKLLLDTNKIADLRNFYKDMLGLNITEDTPQCLTFKVGETLLSFKETANKNHPFYHFAMNIPNNKFQQAKKWLQDRGVKLNREDGKDEVYFETWNAESVYFEDPAGNIVELIARHHLPNKTEGEFSSEDLLNVSEIGIVRDQVLPFVQELNNIGIPCWKEADESFASVGNEEGLVIVVKRGRRWYFSNKDAEIFPVTVWIKGIGKIVQ